MTAEARSRLLVVLTAAVVVLSLAVGMLAVQLVRLDGRNRQTRCEMRVSVVIITGQGNPTPEEVADVMGRACKDHEIFDL